MRVAAFLAVLAGALALAAPAAADRNHYVIPAGHITRFELTGSHGYRVTVSVNQRNLVTLRTNKGPATTEYVVENRSDGEFGAVAKFPGRGSTSFGFTPSGRERQLAPIPTCGGARETVQKGVAHGLIRFRGERDYTTVHTRRVRAEVRSWPRLVCRFLPFRDAGPDPVDARFYALSTHDPLAEFSATRYVEGARPWSRRIEYSAGVASFNEAMTILRTVSVAAAPETFVQTDPEKMPERLVLTPPRPFSGSAKVDRTPESTFTWSGSLKVRFPGIDPVKLAKPSFASSFCADRGCAAQIPKDFFRGLF